MRIISAELIIKTLKGMILKSCVSVSAPCREALASACALETEELPRFALDALCKNAKIADELNIPACQDTGMAVVFLEVGQDVYIEGMFIEDAVNEAVRQAYREGYFRMSVLDPISRINTGDNTPAIIHTRIVKGDRLKISFMAKGFGSENMSRLFMLTPSEGTDGVINAVVKTVREAGGNPCPPVIVGVGIGGTCDKAMEMAKHSLLRDVGTINPQPELNELEKILLDKINEIGIGAQGFGGRCTALAVHVEKFPTHIAGLPVAVNIQCHCSRCCEVAL